MTRQNNRTQMTRPFAPQPDNTTKYVVGSIEWIVEKRLQNPIIRKDTDSYWNSLSGEEQLKLTTILHQMKSPCQKLRKNRKLVSDITRWTNGNNWMMIEGGEHDKMWVNPRYSSTIFESGKLPDITNNCDIYFPLGSSLSDPEGIACYYEVGTGGATYSVKPNKWIEATTLPYHRRRRQQLRRRKRKRYLRQQGLDTLGEDVRAENFIAKTVRKMRNNN
jgi:hypothetical protein